MQRAEAVATIPAAPGEVFAFIADPANLPTWQTGIVSARQTSPGPVGRGSTAQVVRQVLGQRITAELEMAVYEPDRLLELESTVSGIQAEATIELTPAAGATSVRFAMRFTASSLFLTPIEIAAARAAGPDLATSLDRLRSHFAGGAAAPG